MSHHVDPTPPRLTRDLTAKVASKAEEIREDALLVVASPLDWIATHAEVKKLTVRRWAKYGSNVRRAEYTGPRANAWITFVDAVDALMSACANAHAGEIGKIAANEGSPKQRLDARAMLLKRVDAHEAQIDAVDVEVEVNDSVAHIPQDVLDELSDVELEALAEAQEALTAALSRVEVIISAASGRLGN